MGHAHPAPRLARAFAQALALTALLIAQGGAMAAPTGSQLTCHVASDGTAAAMGADWNNATTLQAALGSGACSTIRIKQGVYRPAAAADRAASFAIHQPVQLLGGYTGNALSPEERTSDPRKTVLSGDIDDDDRNRQDGITPQAADIQGGNSLHVVVIGGLGNFSVGGPYTRDNTRLDTLTITGGSASATSPHGAGLYCNGAGLAASCSPTLHNLLFSGNSADGAGGHGGALYSIAGTDGSAAPLIRQSTFIGNAAASGAAVYSDGWGNGSAPTEIHQSTFAGNAAAQEGGALYLRVARVDAGSITQWPLRAENNTFSGNTARRGAAVYSATVGVPKHTALMRFSTFSDNVASEKGHVFFNAVDTYGATQNAPIHIVASVLWSAALASGTDIYNADGNNALLKVEYSLVRSANANPGNLYPGSNEYRDQDFLTTNRTVTTPDLGPLQNNGGPTRTFLPGEGTAAVDAVPSYYCVGLTDQRGQIRPQGTACDIGAVERQGNVELLVQVTTAGGSVSASSTTAPVTGGIAQCSQPAGAGTPANCLAGYLPDGQNRVTLTATPAPAFQFARWANDCSGNATTCSLTMERARNVLAMFVPSTTYTGPNGDGDTLTLALDSTSGGCVLNGAPTFTAPAPNALPPGHRPLGGQIDFQAMYCIRGERLGVALTLPENVPANARLFKYLDQQWVPWPIDSLQGPTVRFSITDNHGSNGGAGVTGDNDPAPGAISDPVMLAVPLAGAGGADPVAIPALGAPALALLGTIMAAAAALMRRPRRTLPPPKPGEEPHRLD